MPEPKKLPKNYENNPFFVASNGMTLLFNLAKPVGVFLVFLSVVSFLFSRFPSGEENKNSMHDLTAQLSAWTPSDWGFAISTGLIIGLAVAMIAALIGGVSSYTAAQIAKGRHVTLSEAFRVSFDNLWSYLWLKIIIFVKVILWSLLLIVPGIIMSVRYSLADIAFFDDDKNLRGNAAVKESLRLTKGAWLTTFASNALFNLLTLGAVTYVVSTSANAVLYRQFDKLSDKKPDAHWLSWVTLVLPFIFILFILALIISIAVAIGLIGQSTF